MKYYIYLSDEKVDMLFSQIPRRVLQNLAGELSISLGPLTTALRKETSEESRYSKLHLVSKYIEKRLHVGRIDRPLSYFGGTVTVRWGKYHNGGQPLVYFGGRVDQTVFGLCGSAYHLLGSRGSTTDQSKAEDSEAGDWDVSWSQHITRNRLQEVLSELLRESREQLLKIVEIEGDLEKRSTSSRSSRMRKLLDQSKDVLSSLHAVYLMTSFLRRPDLPDQKEFFLEQRVEFLARKLEYTSDRSADKEKRWRPLNLNVLLGSPIYVALAD